MITLHSLEGTLMEEMGTPFMETSGFIGYRDCSYISPTSSILNSDAYNP